MDPGLPTYWASLRRFNTDSILEPHSERDPAR
jgi:hypothetical protein